LADVTFLLTKNVRSYQSEELITLAGASLSREDIGALRNSPYVVRVEEFDDPSSYRVEVLLKEKTLTTLPIFICTTIVRQIHYMSVEDIHRHMFSILVILFPESIQHIPGLKFEDFGLDPKDYQGGHYRQRSLYLSRIVRSWKSKRTLHSLEFYLWSAWLKVTGYQPVSYMKRAAPSGDRVLGTLVGSYSLSNRLIQVRTIKNSKTG